MSEISAGRRDSLVELFYAVYKADADGVLAALIDLNIIVPTADPLSLRRAIAFGLENLTRKVWHPRCISQSFERVQGVAHRDLPAEMREARQGGGHTCMLPHQATCKLRS